MGVALVITALVMSAKQMGWIDLLGTGKANGLHGIFLVLGIVVNFILGALMTAGVGLYAPCMAMIYMLGLNPLVAFPIMMASCAGLMPTAGVEFIKTGDYSRVGTIGIALGGIVGVIIAATLVKSMPMDVLTWLIIVVILYTSITYIRKGLQPAPKEV
jgi:uncharacterized membrane protein YfcA